MTPLMCQKCLLFIMCVGMLAHVLYAYEFAGVCVCPFMYMLRPEQNFGCFPILSSTLFLEKLYLLNWKLTSLDNCLSVSAPNAWVLGTCIHAWLRHVGAKIQTQVLIFAEQYSYPLNHLRST